MKSVTTSIKYVAIIVSFFLGAMLVASSIGNASQTHRAVKGILDLSEFDFSSDVTVPLNGEWEFYWNQLLTPEDFAGMGVQKPEFTGYVDVPHQWRGSVNGVELKKHGCATYRLRIKVQSTNGTFGLKTGIVRMQNILFVNGVLQGGSGRPSIEPTSAVLTENTPYTVYFVSRGGSVEFILQVADHVYNGGIILPAYFGGQTAIQALDRKFVIFEAFAAACVFCGGFYNLGVFLVRRRDRSLLYFSLFCIFLFISYITLGQKLLSQFIPDLSYTMVYRIRTLSLYSSVVLMALFLQRMMDGSMPGWLIRGIIFLFGGYALTGLVFAPASHIIWQSAFVSLTVAVYIVFILLLVRYFFQGRYGSLGRTGMQLLILALLCYEMEFLVSILYLRLLPFGNLNSRILGDVCVVFFVLVMSYMLSIRFSNAYSTIESLSMRLKEQNELKDAFLTNTAHEIQTPLHGIIHMAQAVLEDSTGKISSQQQEKLALVTSSAQRLSILVTDILDFEKIKNNEIRLNLKPNDIHTTVNSVLDVFRHMNQNRQVVLINRVPLGLPPAQADENRLRQILYNLIGNALKFTASGEIAIHAQIHEDKIYVSVNDAGIGIPPDKYDDIFLSFEQVSVGRAEHYGGTGLGLAITRQLVERMHGKIWVAWSEIGKGTKITFSLPLSTSAQADKIEGGVQTGSSLLVSIQPDVAPVIRNNSEFTMLAVDDDATNLQIMVNIFAKDNYTILTAANGAAALKSVDENKDIDIVLLDVMMRDMTGYEVCRQLREKYSLLELPILLITARSLPDDVSAGFAAGANDYVIKPFYADELRARVITQLSLKKAATDVIRTEVAFLQSQIKPHFFYNVLNTIVSLCYTDSRKAGILLTEFSNYLRRSFDIQETLLYTTLEKELELVKSYVIIEQARFGERLNVAYDIETAALSFQIPPLILQPLVENAVRHGLMGREEGGHIVVTAHLENNHMMIVVSDDGVGMPAEKMPDLLSTKPEAKGVGLRNISRRLLGCYGKNLNIASQAGKGTVVTITIPTNCSEIVQKHLP